MPYEQMELPMPNRDRETVDQARKLKYDVKSSTEEERLTKALAMYREELHACELIFEDRNRIYRNTFEYLGLLGTVTTLIGDVFRLRNMVYLNPTHGREYTEQIQDKLIDVVNQAVISLMMLKDGNYEGISNDHRK